MPAGGCNAAAPVPGGKLGALRRALPCPHTCLQGIRTPVRFAARYVPGAGIASFLKRAWELVLPLTYARHAARASCLQASTERSQALYARHGFVHVADKPLGEAGEQGAPVLRVMVRPPSSAAPATGVDDAAQA